MTLPARPEPPDEPTRCAICGWMLQSAPLLGCVVGNCSLRPLPARFYDPARVKAEYGEFAPVEKDPYVPPPAEDGARLRALVEHWRAIAGPRPNDDRAHFPEGHDMTETRFRLHTCADELEAALTEGRR